MGRMIVLVVGAVLGLVGCAESGEGPSTTRGGPTWSPPPDDGRDPGSPDPGSSDPGPDPDPMMRSDDAGVPDLGAPAGCAGGYVIDAPTMARCAASTRTCMQSCMDETCWDNCLMRDPSAMACEECLYDAFLSCANSRGCQSQYDAIGCCAETCADPAAETCYTTTCATQVMAYNTCIEGVAEACYTSEDVCFP